MADTRLAWLPAMELAPMINQHRPVLE